MTKNDKKSETLCWWNVLFPQVCGVCGKFSNEFLCRKCEIRLLQEAKFVKQNDFQDIKENLNCTYIYFDELLYVFRYEGIIRNMILAYKFFDESYLYETFVNFLLKNKKFFKILKSYDTIIPVPISNKRKKQRGYNQSYLIAKKIAKRLEVQCYKNLLLKIKDIPKQSGLTKENRLLNVKNAYKITNFEKINNKKILVVDDVFTTGSTVNECSRILKMYNPKKIGILTIAKD